MANLRIALVDRALQRAWVYSAEDNRYSVTPARVVDSRARLDLTRAKVVEPKLPGVPGDVLGVYRVLDRASLVLYRDGVPRDRVTTSWWVWRAGDSTGYVISGPMLGAPHGVYVRPVHVQATAYHVDLLGQLDEHPLRHLPNPDEALVWIASEYKRALPKQRHARRTAAVSS